MSSPTPIAPGSLLADRFRVVEVLAGEGSGAVFRATDARAEREVALRVIPVPASAADRERGTRQGKLAARLLHPNVARTVDFGVDAAMGVQYAAADLGPGGTLAALLAQRGAPPLPLALRIVEEAAAGLAAAHIAGAVHGDVHPGMLWLARNEGKLRTVLVGLGIDPGTAAPGRATARYCAPERLRRSPALSPAADVFSLGVMAYEVLAGLPADWTAALLAMARGGTPAVASPSVARPEIAAHVGDAILRALAPDPAQRWATAGEFAAALAPPASAVVVPVERAPAIAPVEGAVPAPAAAPPRIHLPAPIVSAPEANREAPVASFLVDDEPAAPAPSAAADLPKVSAEIAPAATAEEPPSVIAPVVTDAISAIRPVRVDDEPPVAAASEVAPDASSAIGPVRVDDELPASVPLAAETPVDAPPEIAKDAISAIAPVRADDEPSASVPLVAETPVDAPPEIAPDAISAIAPTQADKEPSGAVPLADLPTDGSAPAAAPVELIATAAAVAAGTGTPAIASPAESGPQGSARQVMAVGSKRASDERPEVRTAAPVSAPPAAFTSAAPDPVPAPPRAAPTAAAPARGAPAHKLTASRTDLADSLYIPPSFGQARPPAAQAAPPAAAAPTPAVPVARPQPVAPVAMAAPAAEALSPPVALSIPEPRAEPAAPEPPAALPALDAPTAAQSTVLVDEQPGARLGVAGGERTRADETRPVVAAAIVAPAASPAALAVAESEPVESAALVLPMRKSGLSRLGGKPRKSRAGLIAAGIAVVVLAGGAMVARTAFGGGTRTPAATQRMASGPALAAAPAVAQPQPGMDSAATPPAAVDPAVPLTAAQQQRLADDKRKQDQLRRDQQRRADSLRALPLLPRTQPAPVATLASAPAAVVERPAPVVEQRAAAPAPAPVAVEAPPPAAPAPARADASRVYSASEVDQRPTLRNRADLLRAVMRSYPSALENSGIAGAAVVQFVVLADGRVDRGSVRVVEVSHPGFRTAAAAAIAAARFEPARVDGQAVKSEVSVPLTWNPE